MEEFKGDGMSYTVDRDVLYKALGEIVDKIEACGASPELTDAVSLTSDLRSAVGNEYNPANVYSLIRVLESVNKVQHQQV